MPAIPMSHIMTPKDVANYLQITEITVIRWLRAGLIHGVKVNDKWRTSKDVVDDFVRSRANYRRNDSIK